MKYSSLLVVLPHSGCGDVRVGENCPSSDTDFLICLGTGSFSGRSILLVGRPDLPSPASIQYLLRSSMSQGNISSPRSVIALAATEISTLEAPFGEDYTDSMLISA
jgi:hypothetical protein